MLEIVPHSITIAGMAVGPRRRLRLCRPGERFQIWCGLDLAGWLAGRFRC